MMEFDETKPPGLATMNGQTQYTVTLTNSKTKETEDFALAAPQAVDLDDAKDFIVRLRTKKVIDDIAAATLDAQTKSMLIAAERQSGRQQLSVLCDIDGIYYLTFLMAKRGGFPGDWNTFRASLHDANIKELQDILFELCGIEVPKPGEVKASDPFGSPTNAP